MRTKKIGFIYLDELLHIHHFLSPAIELAKMKGISVDIITYEGSHSYLKKLLKINDSGGVNIIMLNTYWYRKIIEHFNGRKQPSALYIYQKHINKLLAYDALVFTDHTARIINDKRQHSSKPHLCFIDHGAGDRAYGYSETHNLFDLVIVAGIKKSDRLRSELSNHQFELKIGGYSKFDLVNKNRQSKSLFDNSNKTVLYAPHFDQELTSWHKMGEQVLDLFYKHKAFNLIFAPHFNLFNKKGVKLNQRIDKKYINASNIIIDTGSISSVDMTYTLASDIYLGDISSQVYEFMLVPRPLIFLNTHDIDWHQNEDYLVWQAGNVVQSIDGLKIALSTIRAWSEKLKNRQKELFEITFELMEEKSGLRTARLIEQTLNE